MNIMIIIINNNDNNDNYKNNNTNTKRVQDKAWVSKKGNPLGIKQEIDTWLYYQMVYAKTRISPKDRDS